MCFMFVCCLSRICVCVCCCRFLVCFFVDCCLFVVCLLISVGSWVCLAWVCLSVLFGACFFGGLTLAYVSLECVSLGWCFLGVVFLLGALVGGWVCSPPKISLSRLYLGVFSLTHGVPPRPRTTSPAGLCFSWNMDQWCRQRDCVSVLHALLQDEPCMDKNEKLWRSKLQ